VGSGVSHAKCKAVVQGSTQIMLKVDDSELLRTQPDNASLASLLAGKRVCDTDN